MLSLLDIEAVMALHASNHHFTPSTLARQGSQTSITSADSTTSPLSDHTSHNHHLFHSLHNLRTHWREHIWTHHTIRLERISLGHLAPGGKVLSTREMEGVIGRVPEITRGFKDCLPVAGEGKGVGFVGWRVKGATFPREGKEESPLA